jgi:uncharacterized membrane protein YfcA
MLSFRSSNINISPVELITGYPSNIIILWKERKSLSAKVWIPLACLVITGSLPGAFLLKNGDTTIIKIAFGITVVLIAIEIFFREYQKEQKKPPPIVLIMIGFVSGLLCGLFGIGALLAAYVSRTTNNSSSFRGNLCIVFLIESTFRIIIYSFNGILNGSTLKTGIILIPFMFIGLIIGMNLASKLNEKIIKKVIIIMLILSGLSLIINNIKFL